MIKFVADYFFFVFLVIWIVLVVLIITSTNWNAFSKAKNKFSMGLLAPLKNSPFMKFIHPKRRKIISILFMVSLVGPFLTGVLISIFK